MSSPSDSNTGASGTARIDATGAGGTARIDARPGTGASGTARVAAPATGAGGTARVAAAATGANGTARVGAAPAKSAGPAGTARVGAAPAAVAPDADAGAADTGQHLMVGQGVTLHGVTYQVESALSTTTSEARTYVVSDGQRRLVLKQYREGLHAPLSALQALKAQPHHNVVGIVDFGTEGTHDFELLEYFAAGTLDQLLRREGPLQDLDRLRRLASQIADGLEHLHQRVGLINQDLKPENVLISGPDLARVALADFGISTLRASGQAEVQVTANGTRAVRLPLPAQGRRRVPARGRAPAAGRRAP